MSQGFSNVYSPVEYDFSEKEPSTLLILGNGFDLDLGFPTKYENYFNSDMFPFVKNDHNCHSLGRFVYNKGFKETWYDLENLLAEYGKGVGSMGDDAIQGDKNDYCRLVQGLADYLASIDFTKPKIDSVAAKVLLAADNELVPPVVYTFNYSSFDSIASALGISYSTAKHVHGSLKTNDIVLGVGEYVKLGPSASYLHKTSNHSYDSKGLLNVLGNYQSIIIFGLSLSQVDYPYFEDFFKDIASRKFVGEQKRFIRIFTKDEKSRLEILDNLRGMNSGLIKLFGYSDFDIIRIEDSRDEKKIEEVLNHLSLQ